MKVRLKRLSLINEIKSLIWNIGHLLLVILIVIDLFELVMKEYKLYKIIII